MAAIPIFRSTHLLPFINFCKTQGLSYQHTFNEFKIPILLEADDDIYLPWHAGCNALEELSLQQGVNDFTLRVNEDKTLVDWGDEIMQAVNGSASLFQAIAKLKYLVKLEDTTLSLDLYYENDRCWLKASSIGMYYHCNAWNNLSFLICVVREFMGYSWVPKEISLADRKQISTYIHEQFPNTRFSYNPNSVGISFPKSLLAHKPLFPINTSSIQILDGQTISLESAVKGLAKGYLKTPQFNLAFIAEQLGMNSRTLQRKFKATGKSYSELVDEIRFERTSHLLKNNDLTLMDIAYETGFSDAPHLIRFFKRMTHITPKDYRNALSSPVI